MTIAKLMELRNSPQAPYEHQAYTVWLHNKIIDHIRYELWQFRENKCGLENGSIKVPYVACNNILMLEALQQAK